MATKNQLIKLLEKKGKQEEALRELEARIHDLADELCCGDVLQICRCGEPMLVQQWMPHQVCKSCFNQLTGK